MSACEYRLFRLGDGSVKAISNPADGGSFSNAVKHSEEVCVLPDITMMDFINTILMLGGLAAASAVAVMCGVCLVVWLAGGNEVVRK